VSTENKKGEIFSFEMPEIDDRKTSTFFWRFFAENNSGVILIFLEVYLYMRCKRYPFQVGLWRGIYFLLAKENKENVKCQRVVNFIKRFF
jgi:hypothetical protein